PHAKCECSVPTFAHSSGRRRVCFWDSLRLRFVKLCARACAVGFRGAWQCRRLHQSNGSTTACTAKRIALMQDFRQSVPACQESCFRGRRNIWARPERRHGCHGAASGLCACIKMFIETVEVEWWRVGSRIQKREKRPKKVLE